LLGAILSLLVGGLVIGALARFALPGKDPLPIWGTILLGVAGSIIGGLVATALGAGSGDPWTYFVASLAGATFLLFLYRRFVQKRPLTGPGAKI